MLGFSDETYIDVSSGNGGAGCVSFHREKFIPKGGPDGGDGGRGGDVVFVVKDNLRTLGHLKMIRTFRAENGRNGQGDRCFGRDGRDVEIPVPPGTVIKNAETGEVIKDLTGLDRYVFLKGGKGGLGNWHFRSSVRQTPRFAQPGEEGVSMRIGVELLVIADIGFVGFPNAGKSSLLNLLTNARSKVAGYPFTTKIPQLGVMRLHDRDVILADIPGIIEGASEGSGMGFRFLRHISRTKGLAYLVDLSDPDFLTAFDKLHLELSKYSEELAQKPYIIIGTKIDEDGAEENMKALREKYSDQEVLPLSIYMDELLHPVEEAFFRMADSMEGKVDNGGGFTSRMDLDAEYRDEE
ncbi:MAG: GTPase ObgE [Candidatus Ornithospirochaeta sp.]|nr:GTPase ObgE [Candidatus Ornithospirochaeta sp.]